MTVLLMHSGAQRLYFQPRYTHGGPESTQWPPHYEAALIFVDRRISALRSTHVQNESSDSQEHHLVSTLGKCTDQPHSWWLFGRTFLQIRAYVDFDLPTINVWHKPVYHIYRTAATHRLSNTSMLCSSSPSVTTMAHGSGRSAGKPNHGSRRSFLLQFFIAYCDSENVRHCEPDSIGFDWVEYDAKAWGQPAVRWERLRERPVVYRRRARCWQRIRYCMRWNVEPGRESEGEDDERPLYLIP